MHKALHKNKRPPKDELPELRAWWDQLPQWEKELRLLWFLSFTMPYMGPPTGIIDTGPANGNSFLPFLDPAKAKIHPYVKRKYLDPLLTAKDIVTWASSRQSLSESLTGGPLVRRVYPPLLISPGDFEASGCFPLPYRNTKEVINRFDEAILLRLQEMRTRPALDVQPENLQSMFEWRMPKTLRDALASLASKRVDVARVFGTLFYSGSGLCKMLAFYRKLGHRQTELRKSIVREERSIRSLQRFWRRRFSSAAIECVEREAREIFDSLKLIKHPLDDAVRKYQRSLGIHRKGTKLSQQDFWRILIGWTVVRLKEKEFTEKKACQAVTRLLHATWPKIHTSTWNAVKSRYYRTL